LIISTQLRRHGWSSSYGNSSYVPSKIKLMKYIADIYYPRTTVVQTETLQTERLRESTMKRIEAAKAPERRKNPGHQ
jgi:hypothetical protein